MKGRVRTPRKRSGPKSPSRLYVGTYLPSVLTTGVPKRVGATVQLESANMTAGVFECDQGP